MLAIIVKEPFNTSDVWARIDVAPLDGPEFDDGIEPDVRDFIDGTRGIYRRSNDMLPGDVRVTLAVSSLADLPTLDRDGEGGYLNETLNWHLGSLLLDCLTNDRTVEFLFYRSVGVRGKAYVGRITGPKSLQMLGDVAVGVEHDDPGGNVPGEIDLKFIPLAYGVCGDVAAAGFADYLWLAGDTGIYDDEIEET